MNALSSRELAEMDLPMLPKSKQGVEYHAKNQSWPYQEVSGQARGGKLKKYLISGLPAEIQTAIKEKQAAALLARSVPVNLPAAAAEDLRRRFLWSGCDVVYTVGGFMRRQSDMTVSRSLVPSVQRSLHSMARSSASC